MFANRRIFDCFPFFNELDVLEIRLSELFGIVDFFVIVEATTTFQGNPKPLWFADNRKRYEAYASKIRHVVVDLPVSDDPWVRERFQRACIRQHLSDAADDDIVIISDADEIPRAAALIECSDTGLFCLLEMDHYYFYMNWRDDKAWIKSYAAPWRFIRSMPDVNDPRWEEIGYLDRLPVTQTGGVIVKNAGWHLAWLGGVGRIRQKLAAFSHTEAGVQAVGRAETVGEALSMKGSLKEVVIDRTFPAIVSGRETYYREVGLIGGMNSTSVSARTDAPNPAHSGGESVITDIGSSGERTFDTKVIRRIHATPLKTPDLPDGNAFWCEWNHPNERHQQLEDIIAMYTAENWRHLIKPGATCIDIGAHSGDTAIPMGVFTNDNRNGIRGRVFALEPNPEVFPVLEINLALNAHICDFIPHKLAITKESATRVAIADHRNSNCNGGIISSDYSEVLKEKLDALKETTFVAEGISLERFFETQMSAHDQCNLSFIKIDCEGYDKEILKSSRDFLRGIRPVLFVEWFNLFSDEDSLDLFDTIEDIGFTAYESHSRRPASRERRVSNLILMPKTT